MPNVIGRFLRPAKVRIVRAHCRVGRVTFVLSAKSKKGRVLAEKPRPRTRLKNGARVNLRVGRGPRRR